MRALMPERRITSNPMQHRRTAQITARAPSSERKPQGTHDLVLFDNVQFIYELALAEMELEALGVDFSITNGLRHFEVHSDPDVHSLRRRVAYFKLVDGEQTDYWHICQRNRTRSVNQYLTHWIYPYKGKFHPQMIRALFNIIGLKQGETVLDPFIGSGTTALEAQLMGIGCIGIDVSPLCVIQSKVKTLAVTALDQIRSARDEMVELAFGRDIMHGEAKKLYSAIYQLKDNLVREFYQMAYLVAVSDSERRRRNLNKSFVKNLDTMIGSVSDLRDVSQDRKLKLAYPDIRRGDCRNLDLPRNSVDGIVTSPPYSIALDYVENDAHALRQLQYDLDSFREKFVGVRGKGKHRVALYNEDMETSYAEMYRVLKPGGYACIVIGNATMNGEEIRTVEFTIDECQKLGFELVRNIDKIIFGLYSIMQKENILVFRKR